MSIFNALNSGASALTAQRLRMDIISSNIANADTTRATVNEAGEHEPYRRKMVVFNQKQNNFQSLLHKATQEDRNESSGVRASRIIDDQEPFKLEYNPAHPDSDDNGYVQLPNVDPLKETVDLMSATRSYEANITFVNATKNMLMKALEIGR